MIKSGQHDPHTAHERVKDMYAWSDVARRTEVVYERAMAAERKDTYERLTRYVFSPLLLSAILPPPPLPFCPALQHRVPSGLVKR